MSDPPYEKNKLLLNEYLGDFMHFETIFFVENDFFKLLPHSSPLKSYLMKIGRLVDCLQKIFPNPQPVIAFLTQNITLKMICGGFPKGIGSSFHCE